MSDQPTGEQLLHQANDAASRGAWQEAYALFLEADAKTALIGAALPVLASVAYASGHLDVTITAWERAYGESVRLGDSLNGAAAAVQIAMHLLLDTALMAPVRGWLRRAERLLEGNHETPVHAWIAVARNYERMFSGDTLSAREWARSAVDLGNRVEPAAAAIGRVAEARSLILDGEVDEGLRLLDEAGVAILSGEIDPLATGIVFCEMVCGLQGLAQYDLAEQWTEAMERWHQGRPVGSVHGRCRVHRAEIFRLRGNYSAAESEALLACEELRPYLRRELGWPLTELGRIRLRMGDLDAAEDAFLEAEALGWDPQPGLALVHLARSRPGLAATSIRNALENPLNVPSKELPPNNDLRRAPLLEAQVEIEIQNGELNRARIAAGELSRIATKFGSKALAASAAHAGGRVRLAEGDAAGACLDFEAAVQLWGAVAAPYEAAISRLWLGNAFRADGEEDLALQKFRAARLAFEQVGARLEATHAAFAIGDAQGLDVSHSARQSELTRLSTAEEPGANVFRREGDYWSIIFEGQTLRLRDLKGMHYLARLLAEPGREFHVLALVTTGSAGDQLVRTPEAEAGLTLSGGLDAGALLDAQAKESYRRRLAEIEEDIEDAEAMGDSERAEQARTERDFLVRELARAVGLGGRDRRAGAISERARASVTRAIRHAMVRIEGLHPPLGEHLRRAIRTGTYCAYFPDTRIHIAWNVESQYGNGGNQKIQVG